MLHRTILFAMTPVALAGGTLTSWLGMQPARPAAVPGTLPRTVPVPSGQGLRIVLGADRMLHARVIVNGIPVDMIVDTGSSRSLLSDGDARKVFGSTSGTDGGTIQTLGGARSLAERQADSVKLGETTFRNLKVGLIEGGGVSVLGLDWLDLAGPVRLRP